jgi:hypothetical protein
MALLLATGPPHYAAQTRFPVGQCDILVTIARVAAREKRTPHFAAEEGRSSAIIFPESLLPARGPAPSPYRVFAPQVRKNRDQDAPVWLVAHVKRSIFLLAPLLAILLPACQSAQSPTGGPGFEQNPTDSGSRYSQFNLTGSRMGMQNTDLDD